MDREYYIYWYQLDNKKAYLIWFSTNDNDGFYVNENGLIPSFSKIENLKKFANENKIEIKAEDPNFFDLDLLDTWLSERSNKVEDHNMLLNSWNLFEDVSTSTNGLFNLENTYNIYERIFWGCNIPAATPEGESFTPHWTKREIKIIRSVLLFGIGLFRQKVQKYQ